MADDYQAIARVMREIRRPGYGKHTPVEDLPITARLEKVNVSRALVAMEDRGWVHVNRGSKPETVRLIGDAADWGPMGPADLLAIDVVATIEKKTWTSPFDVSGLPEALRADATLLQAALEVLERDGALEAHRIGSGPIARVRPLPGLQSYTYARGAPPGGVHINGDVIGRDKYVASDSAVISTGHHSVVVAGSSVTAESLTALIAELRKDPKIDTDALDRLELATTSGISAAVVADHAGQAVKIEPRLLTRLGKWLKGLAAAAQDEAVAIGVRYFLEGSGAVPPRGP